jgi:signal transduction histidine kinase
VATDDTRPYAGTALIEPATADLSRAGGTTSLSGGPVSCPPTGTVGKDVRMWLVPFCVVMMVGVAAGTLTDGLPAGAAGVRTVALFMVGAILLAVALSERIRDLRVVVPALVGAGLCGAGLDWPQSEGPGFVAGYIALAGLAFRAPWRTALLAGTVVVVAVTAAESHESANPASRVLAVAFGAGLLFITSTFAAFSRDARRRAEDQLAREAAARESREQAVALAERSRLARELHDVLAHSLSGLSVQLESARILAIGTGAAARLVEQIASAHRLAQSGMLNARRAMQFLRGEEIPSPARLPDLISETASASGIPITFQVEGIERPLAPEAGLTIYRTVQEALTNVAKHAGRGARVAVRLAWTPERVEVSVADSGGDGVGAGLLSTGFGLTSMAERAALQGGRLVAGPSDHGFTVHLRLPIRSQGDE